MNNNTKKAIMLGALLLGCGVTSLLGSLLGNSNKVNVVAREQQLLPQADKVAFEGTNRINKKGIKQENMLKVYVSGAVQQPGLYDVPQGARADDAVKAAGGMTEAADAQRVNLALRLKDGMQVNVPFFKGSKNYSRTNQGYSYKSEAAYAKENTNNRAIREQSMSRLININTASAGELEALPGIGPSMAQKIIEYRQKQRFSKVEDLVKVPGIGKAKLNRLAGRICV